MLRLVAVAVLIAGSGWPAGAQVFNKVNLDRLNGRLAGRVVDYTSNHGEDRRLCSPILGQKRDLYVYLPPGYDPRLAYPMVLYLHTAEIDEHTLIGRGMIDELDGMIQRGEFPPAIVACPDGTYEGANRLKDRHSLYVNGLGGRFEDHIVQEVIPFVTTTYSVRPERQAHAIFGSSAGGYGGMGLALKHRDFFGAVATLGGPLNMRYDNCEHHYRDDFDPATFRWKETYDPDEVVARFYLGLGRAKARKYLGPVYGEGPGVIDKVRRDNPADLIFSTDLRPGELAIYANFGSKDNWNFDAQDQSFAWLAGQRGVDVTLAEAPGYRHTLRYFRSQQRPAYLWLARQILPPAPRG